MERRLTSTERLDHVRALVEWQARLRDTLDAKLDPGFTFNDRGTLVDDPEDFRLGISTFAGYADLSFIELVASESATVAVLFEATDIVTGLRIREAWFVRFIGDEIGSVIATSSHRHPTQS
jgi:hypothetical protein